MLKTRKENNWNILLHLAEINQAHGKRISLNQIMVCLEQLSGFWISTLNWCKRFLVNLTIDLWILKQYYREYNYKISEHEQNTDFFLLLNILKKCWTPKSREIGRCMTFQKMIPDLEVAFKIFKIFKNFKKEFCILLLTLDFAYLFRHF